MAKPVGWFLQYIERDGRWATSKPMFEHLEDAQRLGSSWNTKTRTVPLYTADQIRAGMAKVMEWVADQGAEGYVATAQDFKRALEAELLQDRE